MKMNFRVVEDIFFSEILKRIDAYFPSFNSIFNKEDGAYPILSELATFIIDHFNDKEIKIQTISFINEAIENGGSETENAIVLQLFEVFYADDALSDEISSLLNSKASASFSKYLREYNK